MGYASGTFRTVIRLAACAAALGAGLSLQSCNIVGGLGVAITGPPKVEKLYDLDKSRSTVVLIDDFRSTLPNRTVRRWDPLESTCRHASLSIL